MATYKLVPPSNISFKYHTPRPSPYDGKHLCVCVLVAQSCPTLCDPMDCSPPGSFVRGILQARILEWVAISSTMQIHSILLQSEGANLAKGIRSIKVRSVKLADEDLQS